MPRGTSSRPFRVRRRRPPSGGRWHRPIESRLMASRRDQKEKLRAERLGRGAAGQAAPPPDAPAPRRKRLVQYGALAGLLAIVVVAALIIASQNNGGSGSGAGTGGDVAD